MIFYKWMTICLSLALTLLFLPPTAGAADTEAANLYDRGQFELSDGNYREALSFLEQAVKLEPEKASYQLAYGQALLHLKHYDEAEKAFQKVLASGPEAQKAGLVEMAALYARLKDYQRAIDYYSQALALMPERADLYLARGSMYMNLDDYDRARAEFRQAVCVNPKMEPAALFYEALLLHRQEDLEGALARMDEALAREPGEGLTTQIENFRESVVKEQRRRKHWSVSGNLWTFYDDNIPMEPLAGWESFGVPPTDKNDFGVGVRANGALYFINRRKIQTGVDYTFRGTFYGSLTEYDTLSHDGGLFLNVSQYPWFFRIRGDIEYFYTDRKSKVVVYSVNPSLARVWGENDRTEILGQYAFKSSRDITDDINRYVANITHFHTFLSPPQPGAAGLTGRGGFRLEHEKPDGDLGFDYTLYEIQTGLSFPLPGLFEGDLGFAYGWAEFGENDLLLPGVNRKDRRVTLSSKVGHAINDYLRLDFYWFHTYNNSNLTNNAGDDPYEFRRNVFTFMLSGQY